MVGEIAMRKIFLVVGFLFAFVVAGYSETEIFEGYDGMKWGTTVEEFLEKYPNAVDVTDEESLNVGEKMFGVGNPKFYPNELYCFFDNKFFAVEIDYGPISEIIKRDAIFEKFSETYGNVHHVEEKKVEAWWSQSSESFYADLTHEYKEDNMSIRIMNPIIFNMYRRLLIGNEKSNIGM